MKGRGRLFDANALLNIMVHRGSEAVGLLKNQSILDLTVYEVGNSIWKLCYLQKQISYDEACKLLNSFMALTEYMNVLTINGIEVGVKELSVKKGLSYYDASYVSVSKNQSFALVTDDERLSKIALQYVKVLSSNNA